jgi:hypothetical protein
MGSFSTIGGGISKLSELIIDADKDWAGKLIKNLGAPVDPGDAARKGDIPLTLKKVAEVSVAAGVSQLVVTGLDINTHKLYVIFFTVKNPTTTAGYCHFCVNGDTTLTNYQTEYHSAYDGSYEAVNLASDARFVYAAAGKCALAVATLRLSPDGLARLVSLTNEDTASYTAVARYAVKKLAAVTNVTEVDIIGPAAGAIGAGSKLLIYGASG